MDTLPAFLPHRVPPKEQQVGYVDTLCLQLDDTKVVSGDGQSVRVWSHVTGRRIATLKGHTGVVCLPPQSV